MKGYANAQLLVTPKELAAMIDGAAPQPSAAARPAPAGGLHRRAHPGAHSSRPLGRQPDRHRPGAAEGVHVDDRARARGPRRHARDAGRRLRRAVRHARRARLLVSRVLRPSRRSALLDGGFNAWTAAGLPVTRDAGPPPTSEWTGEPRGATRSRPGGTCADALGRTRRRDPRYAQRRRVLRHDRPRPARRRHPRRGAHRVDPQPRRADGDFKPAAELQRDVRRCRRHARTAR